MLKTNIVYYDDIHYVKYIPLNGKDLGIKTNFVNLEESRFDGDIMDICTEDGEVILSRGNELTIKLPIPNEDPYNTLYPINMIYPSLEQDYLYIASVEDSNKANKFILPCLGQNSAFFSFTSYMINSYVDQNRKYLLVRYRFSISEDYGKLEEELKKHKNYQGFYDVDSFSVVYRFAIPKEFQKDVETFLEGKYSGLSEKLKNRIRIFFSSNVNPEYVAKILQVLYRSEKLRKKWEEDLGIKISEKAELESKPNKEQEIWTKQLEENTIQRSSRRAKRQL